LCSNAIKEIQEDSFSFLANLNPFKISNNKLKTFKMKLVPWENILEMDLSFNNLDFDAFNLNDLGENINFIKLQNVSILNMRNFSFKFFLNQKITTLDFSNNFIEDFTILDDLLSLVSFELIKVNLQTMSQINFSNMK
jgi:hypothetical protein